jgi:hypothetical protein
MSTFMDYSQNVERVGFDLVVDEIRKRPAFAAGKAVRADVISALALITTRIDSFTLSRKSSPSRSEISA